MILMFTTSIFGQVHFQRDEPVLKICPNVEIQVSYSDRNQQKPWHTLYFIGEDNHGHYSRVSVQLGKSKSEAITRLGEIKDALMTGKDFSYTDHFNINCRFIKEKGNTYCVSYYPTSAYFNFSSAEFQKAINWLQNLRE